MNQKEVGEEQVEDDMIPFSFYNKKLIKRFERLKEMKVKLKRKL